MKSHKSQPGKWLLGHVFVASILLLSACAIQPILGGSNVVVQEIDLTDFDEVEVSDAFDVQIRQGDEFYVAVGVDETALPYLQVEKSGDTLEIGLRPRWGIFFWNINPVLRAEITMPTLVGVTARDASAVDVSGFSTDEEVRFEVTDASSLDGEIDTGETWLRAADASRIELAGDRQDIEVEATDASQVTLHGQGRNATIQAADASHIDLSDFPLRDVTISASDASYVTVDASGTLHAEASDSSEVLYAGDPTLGDISTRDNSSVNAR